MNIYALRVSCLAAHEPAHMNMLAACDHIDKKRFMIRIPDYTRLTTKLRKCGEAKYEHIAIRKGTELW